MIPLVVTVTVRGPHPRRTILNFGMVTEVSTFPLLIFLTFQIPSCTLQVVKFSRQKSALLRRVKRLFFVVRTSCLKPHKDVTWAGILIVEMKSSIYALGGIEDCMKLFLKWVFPKIGVGPPNRVFHYKPSILGYPYFWKHPNICRILSFIQICEFFCWCFWDGSWPFYPPFEKDDDDRDGNAAESRGLFPPFWGMEPGWKSLL